MQNAYYYETRVLIGDVDFYKMVYYTKFIKWCSKAREKCLIEDALELGVFDEVMQIGFVTVEVSHKFHKPGFLGDKILIEMTFNNIKKVRFDIKFNVYSVVGDERKLLGIHNQKIIIIDKNGKISKMPENVFQGLKKYEAEVN